MSLPLTCASISILDTLYTCEKHKCDYIVRDLCLFILTFILCQYTMTKSISYCISIPIIFSIIIKLFFNIIITYGVIHH